MPLFREQKQMTLVAMAAGVGAAEGASILYYMIVPWFLLPGQRSLYSSLACNLLLITLVNKLVRTYWSVRTWKDAIMLSTWLSLCYAAIHAPYVITWWNPMSYTYLAGPIAHTLLQLSAMTVALWYINTKR
ncbi:hypothetical protein MAR_038532 [Mya arenaria]|uniref:Uncharacterized protein n=2 Tax=Mya arenaria TaxID=6604 RepID=A0ABY7FVJ1_MYAAR|nr:hypothetical protein MAR_038532 [Mya arenaria]